MQDLDVTPTSLIKPGVGRWLLLPLVVGTVVSTGCNELLDVEVPSQVIAEELDNPALADLMIHSALTDFECAFGGYVVAQAVHGDELADGQTRYGGYWGTDRRTTTDEGNPLHSASCDSGLEPEGFPGIYTPLQVARFQGDDVARRLVEEYANAPITDRDAVRASMLTYAGYAIVLLGESYCSLAFDVGPELTRTEAFGEAEARFTEAVALAQGAGAAEIRTLAYLGRARARLNMGVVDNQVVDAAKLAEAAADAQQVPSGFVWYATFGADVTRRSNNTYYSNNFAQYFTVEDDFRNLTHQGVPDPRVAVVNAGGTTNNGLTPLWVQSKYASVSDPMPVARYAEAQLIIAEAEGGATAEGIINDLHAAAGIPPYGGGTAAEIQQHIIEERAHELFLEGHHLGDKLRYNLPFTPAAGTPHISGGPYGSTTCLPLPLSEKDNNPNIN